MKTSLYNVKSKKKLMKLLFIESETTNIDIMPFINDYKIYVTTRTLSNGKKKYRIVETPNDTLRTIHDRIFMLLKSIELPDYLISKKGSSYVDNHVVHKDNNFVVSLDINKFFPNCSFKKIYRFFYDTLNMSPDAAYMISRILTVEHISENLDAKVLDYINNLEAEKGISFPKMHLPTGSSVSSLLSFLTYREMFDEIFDLAARNNINMTVYVDDITMSSKKKIKPVIINKVIKIVHQYGHTINESKTKYHPPFHDKNITGVVVNKNKQTKVPNKLHLKYKNSKMEYEEKLDSDSKKKLVGIQSSMKQIVDK